MSVPIGREGNGACDGTWSCMLEQGSTYDWTFDEGHGVGIANAVMETLVNPLLTEYTVAENYVTNSGPLLALAMRDVCSPFSFSDSIPIFNTPYFSCDFAYPNFFSGCVDWPVCATVPGPYDYLGLANTTMVPADGILSELIYFIPDGSIETCYFVQIGLANPFYECETLSSPGSPASKISLLQETRGLAVYAPCTHCNV
jgi:hypothetical protein